MATHTAHLGTIVDPGTGADLDQAVLTIFRGPNSFTGDDVVELSVHGSRWIQRRLIDILVNAGARLALPGEYTRRAFSAGKIDLAEAEGVADLIASSSAAAHRIALSQMRGGFSARLQQIREQLLELASLLELELDFSEEDVEFASRQRLLDLATTSATSLQKLADGFTTGAAIKDGIPVAIVGKTNVGKSSLLNALLGDERAIVSDIHGTTRDVVEDTVEIGPYLIRFKDTAGIRHSNDPIENMGIQRSRKAAQAAQIVLCVIDATDPQVPADDIQDIPAERIIYILNKTDLSTSSTGTFKALAISAKTGQGLDELRQAIAQRLDQQMENNADGDILVTNQRHAQALAAAADSLRQVAQGIETQLPPDLVAQDLREAIHHLSTITGKITTPEILQSIFTNFCIGK